MQTPKTILIASAQEARVAELTIALQGAGYHVQRANDLDECLDVLREEPVWSLLLDEECLDGPLVDALGVITDTNRHVEGGIRCFYEPKGTLDFRGARRAGVRGFVAWPAPADLVLCLLELSPDAPESEETNTRGFVSQDAFQRQADRSITEARAKERHVAVLCLGFGSEASTQNWVGMEPEDRREVERWLQGQMEEALRPREGQSSVIGVTATDLFWTWVRPDRIAILVPGLARVQDVAKLGAGLQVAFQMSGGEGVERWFQDVAQGAAMCPGDATNGSTLIDCAMRATDRGRTEGVTSLAFHTQSMGLWAFERLTLEDSLHNALVNEEFKVFYQPRVDAHSRSIVGVEALVRWVHPQLGMVSPAQFIPLAEETGLIVPIGEWVLREACRQNQAWREAGFQPIRVSVNLSPVQFRDAALTDVVDSALEESGLSTDGLELEVTESMLMNDPDQTIAALQQLKSRGLKISIDDFGTGYSSLSYLKQFPIDSLKIDRSFIRDVTTNSDDAAITTAVILMGHSLKLNVVAEGVENENQLAFLQVLQCNEIQGYYFSPPVPADKLETMLPKVGATKTF